MKRLVLALGIVAAAMTANGATVFHFTSLVDSTSGFTSGVGNIGTYAAGGINLTANAWALTGGVSPFTFEKAELVMSLDASVSILLTGLGNCDAFELNPGPCVNPQHKVDNQDRIDFILFQFDTP